VVLAHPSPEDWILGQITSNAYGDPSAFELSSTDMAGGSLQRQSFFRPGKIFTAHRSLISAEVAVLNAASARQAIKAVVALLERGQP
jgi:mRNA interferase MazF